MNFRVRQSRRLAAFAAWIFCLSAPIAATSAAAGPLAMGTTLAELQRHHILEPVSPYEFRLSSSRLAGPEFEAFSVVVTPLHGLCEYVAWGKPIQGDLDGDVLRSRFDSLLSSLGNRYGDAEIHDALRPDSLWSDPRDWRRGLTAQERSLSAVWRQGNHELPDHLAAVQLKAKAVGESSGRIYVAYQFTNAEECRAWIHARTNRRL
jgi:hypothetical protein